MKRLLYITLLLCSLVSCTKESNVVERMVIADDYIYRIPVAFHILYNDYDHTNIPAQTIKELLDGCNKIFNNGHTPALSTNMNINFFLATHHPDGTLLAEPGIERIKVDYATLNCEEFLQNQNNTKYFWNQNEYINVCLFVFKENNILGISHMPFTDVNNPLTGLIQGNVYYNTLPAYPLGIALNSGYINKHLYNPTIVKTLAHEIGHYLGLKHVFYRNDKAADKISNYRIAQDNDHCTDTYTYDRDEYDNILKSNNMIAGERYSRNDPFRTEKVIADNYMDYDYCHFNSFTPQQRDRVRHVLMYSPLIPGPKLVIRDTKSSTENHFTELPPPVIAY